MTTPEDKDKDCDRIMLIRGVGAAVSYLKAVVRVHQQFCFWLHISGCVWLVHCQPPQPSWDSFAHVNICDTHHKAVRAMLQTNTAVAVVKKDCHVNVLFGLGSESPWECQLPCP